AFLLNTSVTDNIQFSRPYVAKDQIKAVAQSAHAHNFIKRLDQGYNTIIGDRGLRLSGGQQQRLALARALFLDPEILVLDEATSALDTQSERTIQSTLEKMHSSRTILIIAHRLSTIVNADRIVVVEDGKIVEQGTRNELLALDGRFANLWKLQGSESTDKLS
ncbi:MAG: ATP-binding cassette domain-containing protein, partial [Chloroflexota bacterium]|nr:ATP-binding cassette domain-containing protein [Chloroflexota bacterium]